MKSKNIKSIKPITPRECMGTCRGIIPRYPKIIERKKAIGIREITMKFAEHKALL
jgi:hypothetical protein